MKNYLRKLKALTEGKINNEDKSNAEIYFYGYAYKAILAILLSRKPSSNETLDDLWKWVLSAASFFTNLPTINYEGSFSMINSFYEIYCMFESNELIDILSNKGNLYYDNSKEALLAILFAFYENETGESVEELLYQAVGN